MKLFIVCACLLGIGTWESFAQNNDSIDVQQLDELTVEANLNTTDARGAYFVPTTKQKNSALNGIDLLRRMTIPQIKVGDSGVTTNTGQAVTLFVNYHLASSEELEGLKTTDVRKVEYFYSPSDPRFMGERNVLNFIVQEYEYGGYTKLSVYEHFFTGFSSNASAYSKFTFKKMTYDIYAGSVNSNNHHTASKYISSFYVKDDDGQYRWIDREQLPDRSHYTKNNFPVSFRASYTGNKFQTQNTISFAYQDIPRNDNSGSLSFNPMLFPTQTYSTSADSRLKQVSYSGNFNFTFPRQYSLSILPQASYARNNSHYRYISNENTILNDASENTYSASVMAMGRKVISDVHYLFLRGFGGYTRYGVTYSGSSPSYDKIVESYEGASFQYGYYTNKFTADFCLGVRGESNITNDSKETVVYPFANSNFGWSPNGKHSINLGLTFSKNPMDANLKSPNVLQQNELLYYRGNSSLEYSRNIIAYLGYNWMPNNHFQMSPYSQFFGLFDRYVPIYSHYQDGKSILRRYENSGDHFRTQVGVSFSLTMLDGNLQIQLSPSQYFYRSTGYYDMNYNPFSISGSIIYYLGRWYFTGYYSTRNRALWSNSGTIFKDKSVLYVTAGWSNANLNIRLGINNPFRKSWLASETSFDTPVYRERVFNYGNGAHYYAQLSVTYTIGYGKKVAHNNEIGQPSTTSSAILK